MRGAAFRIDGSRRICGERGEKVDGGNYFAHFCAIALDFVLSNVHIMVIKKGDAQ
jgi:hypothetical protein